MALAVALTQEAKTQLQELEAYLADRFYPGNARRYMDRLMEACLAPGNAPHRGRRPTTCGRACESLDLSKVSVYFKVVGEQVFIVGVLYGGRTFESSELGRDERRRDLLP